MNKNLLRAFALTLALLMALSTSAMAADGSLTVSNIGWEDAQGNRTDLRPTLAFTWAGSQDQYEVSAALTLDKTSAKGTIGVDANTLYGYFDGSANRYTFDLSKASEMLGGLVAADESSFDAAVLQDMIAAYARLIAKSGDKAYSEALGRKMAAGLPIQSAAETVPTDVCGQSYDLYRHSVTLDGTGIVALLETCKEADEDFAAYWSAYEKLLEQAAQGMTFEQMLTGDNLKLALTMDILTQDADPGVQSDVMLVQGTYAIDAKNTISDYPSEYAADYAADGPTAEYTADYAADGTTAEYSAEETTDGTTAEYAAEDAPSDAMPEWMHMEMPFAAGMVKDDAGMRYDYSMDMSVEGAHTRVTVNMTDDFNGTVAVSGEMMVAQVGQGEDGLILKAEYAQQPVEGGWDGALKLSVASDPTGMVGEGAFTCDLSCREAVEEAQAPENDIDITDINDLSEETLEQLQYDFAAFALKAGGICMQDPVLSALINARVESPLS